MNHSVWLVGLGGAIGCMVRYSISVWTIPSGASPSTFPIWTLSVNLVGSLLAGVIGALLHDPASEPWRMVVLVGFLGGLTTFSAFSLETVRMAETGAWGTAAWYVVLSVIGGLSLAATGYAVTRSLIA